MSFCGHAALSPDMPLSIDRMLRAVTLGSPRAVRQWTGDGVRFGVADGARLASGDGERVALIDGSIHNHAALAAAIGVPDRSSDADLVLAAHARWGDAFVEHVIGDFACVLWDGVRRRMILAVDPGGMRPLVMWRARETLRFASEPRGLLADPEVDRVLDERRVGAWLSIQAVEPDRTFFKGMQRVPPGGRAIWQDGVLTVDYWWHPERAPTLHLPRHADYVEAVRACLDEAVACRLGTDERIGSQLSGGLDSSAVTALAAKQLAAQGRPLTAFTAAPARPVANQPGRFADEWPHAAAVAALYPNVAHVRVANDDLPLMDVLDAREGAQDVPLFNVSNTVWANAIEREARARGVTVLLVGNMGNMTFSYDGGSLARMQFRRGRADLALATILATRRATGARWRSVLGATADTVLPPRWSNALRRAVGKGGLELGDYSLITPGLLATAGLDGARGGTGNLRNAHPDDSRALRIAVMRRMDVQGEFAAASRRLYGIDTRDPTHDRRLVELCLSIPEEQFLHHGLPRAIARHALVDALPATVTGEMRKGLQAADWAHGVDAALPRLRAEVERLRASPSLPGWTDLDRMQRLIDTWPGPAGGDAMEAVAVTRAMALGRFVRRFEGGNQ